MFQDIYTTESTNKLLQGDIFKEFDDNFFLDKSEEIGWLVVSYSCDIQLEKLEHLCFTPIYDFNLIINGLMKEHNRKTEKNFKNEIVNRLHEIINHRNPTTFFLTPTPEINNNKPTFSDLNQIHYLPFDRIDKMINTRILSLKNPWREKLGYMVGYLFNRIALDDLKRDIAIQYVDDDEEIKLFIEKYIKKIEID